MINNTFTMTVGFLGWGSVRKGLEKANFHGLKIECIESSGWFKRDFTFKGNIEDIRKWKALCNQWILDNTVNDWKGK